MKRINFVVITTLIGLMSMFVACAKPPVAEMNTASEAVSRAEGDVDVAEYAADSLKVAQQSLSRMKSEAESKHYDSAKSLAAETVTLAEKAISEGKRGKARAQQEAIDIMKKIESSLDEVEQAFSAAKTVRRVKLDVDSIQAEIESAKRSIAAAKNDFSSENYPSAIEKAETIRTSLASIESRISDAVRTATKKK